MIKQATHPQSRKIEDIRKNFHKEWLLIAIDSVDNQTNSPVTGRLLAHSQRRDDLLKKYINYKGLAMLDFSDDPPKDVAYIF